MERTTQSTSRDNTRHSLSGGILSIASITSMSQHGGLKAKLPHRKLFYENDMARERPQNYSARRPPLSFEISLAQSMVQDVRWSYSAATPTYKASSICGLGRTTRVLKKHSADSPSGCETFQGESTLKLAPHIYLRTQHLFLEIKAQTTSRRQQTEPDRGSSYPAFTSCAYSATSLR